MKHAALGGDNDEKGAPLCDTKPKRGNNLTGKTSRFVRGLCGTFLRA